MVRNISESEKMKGSKLMDSDGLMDSMMMDSDGLMDSVSHKMVTDDVTRMWIMTGPSQLGTGLEGALAFPDWCLLVGAPLRDVIVLGMFRSVAAVAGCGASGIS